MGSSFVLALALALGLGIAAARRPRSARSTPAINPVLLCRRVDADLLARAASDPGVSPPGSAGCRASGIATAGTSEFDDRLRASVVLPVATLTLVEHRRLYALCPRRDARGAGQDHIRTARAKGRKRSASHPAPARCAALIPVTTILALSFGGLVSGALVTETMFRLSRHGQADLRCGDAATTTTWHWRRCCFATVTTMLANLAADLAYGWLDPRVS